MFSICISFSTCERPQCECPTVGVCFLRGTSSLSTIHSTITQQFHSNKSATVMLVSAKEQTKHHCQFSRGGDILIHSSHATKLTTLVVGVDTTSDEEGDLSLITWICINPKTHSHFKIHKYWIRTVQ